MINLYEELVAVVAALEAARVEYAVCGALALAVHGVPRATKDIDILARPEDEAALRAAVRGCGFTLEALPMTFASGVKMQRFSKILEGRPVMLDVLWVSDLIETIWREKETLAWEQGRIHVVSREGLITLKLTAGRPQDLADIQRLMELEKSDGERT